MLDDIRPHSIRRVQSATWVACVCTLVTCPRALAGGNDLTESLLMKKPPSQVAEVSKVSLSHSLQLAWPAGRMREIYDQSGFAGCEPQAFRLFYQPSNWSEAGRYCLERARDAYRAQAFRLSLEEPEHFGNFEHPSSQTQPEVLFKGIPERVMQQAVEAFASRRSAFLTSLLSGQLSFELSLPGVGGVQAAERAREDLPAYRVRYVVMRASPSRAAGPRLASVNQNDAVRLGLAQNQVLRTFGSELQRVEAAGARRLPSTGANRRLVEVIEPIKQEAQTAAKTASGRADREADENVREQIARFLGVPRPVFSSLVARIDRAGADKPDGVSLSVAEGSSSLLFAEARPLSEGNAVKSLSYGFVIPWHAFALRVQHFENGDLPVYQITHVTSVSSLKMSLEETTERIGLEFSCIL